MHHVHPIYRLGLAVLVSLCHHLNLKLRFFTSSQSSSCYSPYSCFLSSYLCFSISLSWSSFDSHLTWCLHCVALRERCAKDLRLLRIVSSRGWGAEYVALRSLYISFICSKLQYGSLFFHTSARTPLEILTASNMQQLALS